MVIPREVDLWANSSKSHWDCTSDFQMFLEFLLLQICVKHLYVVHFHSIIFCTTKATKWSFSLSILREEWVWRELAQCGQPYLVAVFILPPYFFPFLKKKKNLIHSSHVVQNLPLFSFPYCSVYKAISITCFLGWSFHILSTNYSQFEVITINLVYL